MSPGAYDSNWRCAKHGQVLPLAVFHRLDRSALTHVSDHAEVPLWLPDPLPLGWALCGLAAVGDARTRLRATATAFRGPAPLGGTGEWLIVAEEPGIGLGASYAASAQAAPPESDSAAPPARIHAAGHPTPLWPVSDTPPDRSAYVGEAAGVWLWLIGFPADAGYALLEDLAMSDARGRALPELVPVTATDKLRPR